MFRPGGNLGHRAQPGYNAVRPAATKPPANHPAHQYSHTQYMEAMLKRHRTETEYFEADSDEDVPAASGGNDKSSESEEDALDAFMAGIKDDLNKQATKPSKRSSEKDKKAVRHDIEDLDAQELFFKYMEENPDAGVPMYDADDILEYDDDGNPIIPERSKFIDPLPPIDHTEIKYQPFAKNFYDEHKSIAALNFVDISELRRKLGIKVSGFNPPKPITSFAHLGFDEQLMHYIRKSEYSQPTPIQAQGVPIALSGRDIIGIAKTGSGKTAAFVWPMLVHIMNQKAVKTGEGPIGLICAPTRELAQQIYTEVKRFGKAYSIQVVCAYGGGNMWEQQKSCQDRPEVIVCTPGRLIDLVKKKSTNLQRVSFLIFDEADRMFDMGFEPQVRSIANHVRPDRQTLLFSATFRKKVERLARDILTDPIRVVQGDAGEANEDVTQLVEVLANEKPDTKFKWLMSRLVGFSTLGSVLVFATKKLSAEELASSLRQQDMTVGLLHGDMDQSGRNSVITDFKRKVIPIMVATDVASRGLDIPSVKTVVNYDVARDIDTHTHRVGRTGRAGEKGTAYTLITPKDVYFAGDLVRNLEGANQNVPKSLLDLASKNPRFHKTRSNHGARGKRSGSGLGFGSGYGTGFSKEKERPGLGVGDKQPSSKSAPTLGPLGGGFDGLADSSGDRLTSLRNSFKDQYQRHFQKASTSDTSRTFSTENTGHYAMPPKNPALSASMLNMAGHGGLASLGGGLAGLASLGGGLAGHGSLANSGLSLKAPPGHTGLKTPESGKEPPAKSPPAKSPPARSPPATAKPSRTSSKWDAGRSPPNAAQKQQQASRWDTEQAPGDSPAPPSSSNPPVNTPDDEAGNLDTHGYWTLAQPGQQRRKSSAEEAAKRAREVDSMVAEQPRKRKSRWDI